MKKLLLITLLIILISMQVLYPQNRATENVKKYGNLQGTQVELDLFGNIFFGGGSGGSVISVLAGAQAGFDLIFTLPNSSIYGISISPKFSYTPIVMQNVFTSIDTLDFKLPQFSIISHLEYGASLGIHLSYFFSIGVGVYYNQIIDYFLDLDNVALASTNRYNSQDYFSVRVDANFNHFIGSTRRFAFTYGFTVNLNIFEFEETSLSFDGRISLGMKYRFYIGGKDAPRIRIQKDDVVPELEVNRSGIWIPPIDPYEQISIN